MPYTKESDAVPHDPPVAYSQVAQQDSERAKYVVDKAKQEKVSHPLVPSECAMHALLCIYKSLETP